MSFTHLDLFSGIGGFALAARWAGIETVQFVEIDPFCQKVLRKNFPGVSIHDDIKTFTYAADTDNPWGNRGQGEMQLRRSNCRHIKNFDGKNLQSSPFILTGGFPCQPFSCAGKRRGKEDDRYLWPEMLRVISELRPAWVLAENVTGIISMELEASIVKVESRTISRLTGHDFYAAVLTRQEIMLLGAVCNELEAQDYEVQPVVIPACATEAPHERSRVFIVGHASRSRLCREPREVAKNRHPQLETGTLADSDSLRELQPKGSQQEQRGWAGNGGQDVANTDSELPPESGRTRAGWTEPSDGGLQAGCRRDSNHWATEPNVGRVANGIRARMDRLKCLGNAVVPQQVYPILRAIAEIERSV